jgi:predicted RNA-binding protein YlxR (DUF448 family)
MIRLVASEAGQVSADLRGRFGGRGAYACASVRCLERACKGAASRSLKQRISGPDASQLVTGVGEGLERLVAERLGRLQRQRALVIGAADTEAADRNGVLAGVVAAHDLSDRSSKKVDALRAPVYRVADQVELGRWLGRGATGVVGIPQGPAGTQALIEAGRWTCLANSVVG